MYDIYRETAAVMKERVATSTRDGFFDDLEKYPDLLEPTISGQMEDARTKDSQMRGGWPDQ